MPHQKTNGAQKQVTVTVIFPSQKGHIIFSSDKMKILNLLEGDMYLTKAEWCYEKNESSIYSIQDIQHEDLVLVNSIKVYDKNFCDSNVAYST
jgi:hypothetical protein